MLAPLTRAFTAAPPGPLGFYSYDLPSLPSVFEAIGYSDARTKYFFCHPADAKTEHRDIGAHQLLDAVQRTILTRA